MMGSWRRRLPVAWWMALAMAAAAPTMPSSPMPRAPKRVEVEVGVFDEADVEVGDVGDGGEVVLGEVGVDGAGGGGVVVGLFHERHADAEDDAAGDLAAGERGVEDGAAVEGAGTSG